MSVAGATIGSMTGPTPKGTLVRNKAVDEAERLVAALAEEWTNPNGECLACYLIRMLEEFGCDGTLRWTRRWRDCEAPADKNLLRRFKARTLHYDSDVMINIVPDVIPDDDGRLPPCAECQAHRAGREQGTD